MLGKNDETFHTNSKSIILSSSKLEFNKENLNKSTIYIIPIYIANQNILSFFACLKQKNKSQNERRKQKTVNSIFI